MNVMKTPRSVDVEITSRCNLRCTYCYYFDNAAVDYRDLPAEEWVQFFEECASLGVMNLTLAGGEPFMRKDLRKLLDGIVRNRMRYSLLSNGGLIDNRIAAFIAETGRCDYVQISIDGSRPEIHDACRGKGSWKKAVRAIEILQQHQIPVTSRVTIHRRNVGDLAEIADLLLNKLGLESFGTNSAGYLGSCRGAAKDILLSTAERQQAMETLLRLEEKYPGRIQASAGPLAEAHRWQLMGTACMEGAPAFSDGGRLTGCGCTYNKIAVRADGVIIPCSMLAHMELGRINRDTLLDVWQHSQALNDLRNRHQTPLSDFEYCAGCPYMPYCTGNCPSLAYSLTGRVDHPSPDACLRDFLKGAEFNRRFTPTVAEGH